MKHKREIHMKQPRYLEIRKTPDATSAFTVIADVKAIPNLFLRDMLKGSTHCAPLILSPLL